MTSSPSFLWNDATSVLSVNAGNGYSGSDLEPTELRFWTTSPPMILDAPPASDWAIRSTLEGSDYAIEVYDTLHTTSVARFLSGTAGGLRVMVGGVMVGASVVAPLANCVAFADGSDGGVSYPDQGILRFNKNTEHFEISESTGAYVQLLTSAAPVDAQYLTLAANATLANERVFTAAARLAATDGGPNSTYTLDLASGIVSPGTTAYPASITVDTYGRVTGVGAAGAAPVTGTGAANRVAYWSSASAITSNASFVFDGTGMAIGSSSRNTMLDLYGARWVPGANQYQGIAAFYSTDALGVDVGAGLILGGVYSGSNVTEFAQIAGVKANGSGGNYGGAMLLATRVNGGAMTEALRLRTDQTALFASTVQATSVGAGVAPLYPLHASKSSAGTDVQNLLEVERIGGSPDNGYGSAVLWRANNSTPSLVDQARIYADWYKTGGGGATAGSETSRFVFWLRQGGAALASPAGLYPWGLQITPLGTTAGGIGAIQVIDTVLTTGDNAGMYFSSTSANVSMVADVSTASNAVGQFAFRDRADTTRQVAFGIDRTPSHAFSGLAQNDFWFANYSGGKQIAWATAASDGSPIMRMSLDSKGNLGVGQAIVPGARVDIAQEALSSSHVPVLRITGAAHTALNGSNEYAPIKFDLSQTYTWTAGGTVTIQRFARFSAPTFASSSGTGTEVDDLSTVCVDAAPSTGAHVTAVQVQALRVGGSVTLQALSAGVNGTSLKYAAIRVPPHTVTLAGTAAMGAAYALTGVHIGQVTATNPDPITISHGASLYIAGAPLAAGSVALDNPWAMLVNSGTSRFDGTVQLGAVSGGGGVTGALAFAYNTSSHLTTFRAGNATAAVTYTLPTADGNANDALTTDGSGTLAWQGLTVATIFGDGSDGSVTFDGSTTILGMVPSASVYTMTRDIYCTSITINTGVRVKTAGYRVFCTGTFTTNGTGKLDNDGSAGGNGGSVGNSATGGSAGTAGSGGAAGTVAGGAAGFAGTAGGTGTTGNGGAGSAPSSSGCCGFSAPDAPMGGFAGGSGGGGGGGGATNPGNAGGNGGNASTSAHGSAGSAGTAGGASGGAGGAGAVGGDSSSSWTSQPRMLPAALYAAGYDRAPTARFVFWAGGAGGVGGGSGGAGGGDGTNAGAGGGGSGGGGGGGGVLVLAARTIVNNGSISANGGVGGNGGDGGTRTVGATAGGGGAGGGAGGGGGLTIYVYKSFSGNTPTATAGTKGTQGAAGSGHGGKPGGGHGGDAGTSRDGTVIALAV